MMTNEELSELENKFVVLKMRVQGGEKEWRGFLMDCDSGMFSLCSTDTTAGEDTRQAIGSVSDIIEAKVVTKEEAQW